ncbi:MAG: hypothetical protein WCO07_01520 [bacterium]
MKTRNNPYQKTRHHIRPKSRMKGKGVEGVSKLPRRIHELWHMLFGNQLPEETIEFISKVIWNDEYEITIKRRR